MSALQADEERLYRAAFEVMERAYAPYSNFRVGAALLGSNGRVFAGCNVENAAYPSGMCAERGAVSAAVAQGERSFRLLAIATDSPEPTPPCGFCRQVLVEFSPGLAIVSVGSGGDVRRYTLADLLPHAFTPASLPSLG